MDLCNRLIDMVLKRYKHRDDVADGQWPRWTRRIGRWNGRYAQDDGNGGYKIIL